MRRPEVWKSLHVTQNSKPHETGRLFIQTLNAPVFPISSGHGNSEPVGLTQTGGMIYVMIYHLYNKIRPQNFNNKHSPWKMAPLGWR